MQVPLHSPCSRFELGQVAEQKHQCPKFIGQAELRGRNDTNLDFLDAFPIDMLGQDQ